MISRAHSLAAGLALSVVAFVALLGAEPGDTVPRTPRMSEAQSEAIKREWVARVPGLRMNEVELDHCRPLCAGGTNERANLQLQPWARAHEKDKDEWMACDAIRAGRMTQSQAAAWLAERWPCLAGRLNEAGRVGP